MAPNEPSPRRLGWYYALAQVGFEMVAPIALGLWLDSVFDSRPWLVVIGAVLGLAVGFLHLVALLNQEPPENDTP